MADYRIFTFDCETFPEPEQLNEDLHKIGFRSVWMIDPGVKLESDYFVCQQMVDKDLAVKNKSGENYIGSVWPGPCVFPDFTLKTTCEWWSDLYKDFLATGIDGVWNDMNEPSVFDSLTKTMPVDNIHRGYGGGDHAQFHNVYGMLMVKATKEGILKARPDKRPFVLSRANYIGGQRYAATWTGDNQSDWVHLHMSISMILNLGLSGQPFSGPDIGGFSGNATGKLFGRWMGIGALLPFSRGHTCNGTNAHEPWSFGVETEDICRVAMSRRYILLPYIYSLFYTAHKTGLPVARPLFFIDPIDPELRAEDRAFLLGDNLLVVADVSQYEAEDLPEGSELKIPKNVKWLDLN